MADQCCYICGDVGYPELIVTCSKCKVVREHLYCMPSKRRDVPNYRLCDNCTLDGAKSPDDTGLLAQPKMLRHAKTGKVKFLPTEEVIKLSSGGMMGPSKLNMCVAPQRTSKARKESQGSMPRPLFQASKESLEQSSPTMPPKVCGAKKQALTTCLPPVLVGSVQTLKKAKVTDIYACTASASRHGLPVTNTEKEVPSPSTKLEGTHKQMKDALKAQEMYAYRDNRGKEVPSPSTKLKDTQKEMKDALMTQEIRTYCDNVGKEVPSPSTKSEDTQKQMKDALMTQEIHTYCDNIGNELPSPSTKLEDTKKQLKDALMTHETHTYRDNVGKEVPSPSTKLEDTQKQMKDVLMTQDIHTYLDYLPSLHASWKGGFQFVDTRLAGEFYDGFLAKSPCVVNGRAYELSRKIPPILQVKLLSRSDNWDDIFRKKCLVLADIALYFFPSENIERSRKNNSCLFELMEREELLIRSLIDGAELFVFTFRQLDLDSQHVVNMLNAECLLFGVFRAVKDDHNLEECTPLVPMLEYGSVATSVKCASKVPLLECAPNGHGKHDEGKAVNKENDIASTKDIDSTIQRLLLEFGFQKPRESDVNSLTKNVQIQNQEPAPISSIGSHFLSLSKVKTEPLPVIKVEGSNDKMHLEMEHCSRMAPRFSIDGSQNMTGLLDQGVPKRVADKYLQIFNAGMNQEHRRF